MLLIEFVANNLQLDLESNHKMIAFAIGLQILDIKGAKKISEWVEQRLYRGYYTFTSEDVKGHFTSMSETYIKTAINRLVRSGKIISPAKCFYAIVPIAETIVIAF